MYLRDTEKINRFQQAASNYDTTNVNFCRPVDAAIQGKLKKELQ